MVSSMSNKEILSTAGEGKNLPAQPRGRISFRARKAVHASPFNEPLSKNGEDENSKASSLLSSAGQIGSIVHEDSNRQTGRTRRGAFGTRSGELFDSPSQGRKVRRKKAAPSVPTTSTEVALLTTSGDPSKASTVDFWHSSLSEPTGVAADHAADHDSTAAPILATTTTATTLVGSEEMAAAIEHLKRADARLRSVIEMHDEGPKFEKCDSAFSALARSIVFQQLATKAASAIFGRVLVLCGGAENLRPERVAELSKEQLRAVGISERKASYLHDLAAHFASGALSDAAIGEMDDGDLMKALTAVKGIGVWSVHMFMLFSLHRPDVLPVGDLGVRKGFQKLYQLAALPSPAEMERLSLSWQPYRSIGSWYMWRVLDMTLPF
ncbi:hypothetical protein AXG93_1052s1230 [Marchantia polymorpha subsp. ruderalis]|nr:hypothetical protein AXG93_1052s1230 [Marchantia polymorpha subsp. ruderalis]